MRRLLVTGATGCVGRQIVPLLLGRGWDVHAVTLGHAPPDLTGPRWHEADLLVSGEARRVVLEAQPDALLHLAWSIVPGRWATALDNLDWVTASLALGRAFREEGGHRMVVAGSCLEYDWAFGLCSERLTPCRPHTLYGTAKHALHLLLDAYAQQSGLALAWGRIFFLYGPWEHPDRLVGSVIRSLLRGDRARCSHGRQIRDYLYAGDVASALVALLESDVTGAVNIASGQPITLREIATRAGRLLGQEDRIDFGAIPPAPTDTPVVMADVTRLTREVSWHPRVTLDEGLERTIEWWRGRPPEQPNAA